MPQARRPAALQNSMLGTVELKTIRYSKKRANMSISQIYLEVYRLQTNPSIILEAVIPRYLKDYINILFE